MHCLYLHFIINIKNIEIIYNLGNKTVLYFMYNVIVLTVLLECKAVTRKSQRVNTDSQCSKKESCSALATQLWLAVNHNITR